MVGQPKVGMEPARHLASSARDGDADVHRVRKRGSPLPPGSAEGTFSGGVAVAPAPGQHPVSRIVVRCPVSIFQHPFKILRKFETVKTRI